MRISIISCVKESKYYAFLSSEALDNLRKHNKEKNDKMESRQ